MLTFDLSAIIFYLLRFNIYPPVLEGGAINEKQDEKQDIEIQVCFMFFLEISLWWSVCMETNQ